MIYRLVASEMSRLGVRILVCIGGLAIASSAAYAMGQRPPVQEAPRSVTVEDVESFVANAHYFNPCFNSFEAAFAPVSAGPPYEIFRRSGGAAESSADFYDGLTGQFYSIVAESLAIRTALDLGAPWYRVACAVVQAGEARVTFPLSDMGVFYASSERTCAGPLFVAGAVVRPIGAADALLRAQLRLSEQLTILAHSFERDIIPQLLLHRRLLHMTRSCGVFMDERSRAQLNSLSERIEL